MNTREKTMHTLYNNYCNALTALNKAIRSYQPDSIIQDCRSLVSEIMEDIDLYMPSFWQVELLSQFNVDTEGKIVVPHKASK